MDLDDYSQIVMEKVSSQFVSDEDSDNAKSTILDPKFDEEFISDGFRNVRGLLHAEKSIKSHQVEEFCSL